MITHVVHFGFKPEVSPTEQHLVSSKLLLLQDTCFRKGTSAPYILSISGGKNISPEPHSNGLSHTFVVNFESAADRDWYLDDPVHMAFGEYVRDKVSAITVLDFEPGVF